MSTHPHAREATRRRNFFETTLPRVTIQAHGDSPYEWRDVPVQRVPLRGEFIKMVDDGGLWKVIDVEFSYVQGFGMEPDCIVQIVQVSP